MHIYICLCVLLPYILKRINMVSDAAGSKNASREDVVKKRK